MSIRHHLQPDDDARIDPDYVENHIRHSVDDRVDVVSPVSEWDSDSHERYVKWKNHLMIAGSNAWGGPGSLGPAGVSGCRDRVRPQSSLDSPPGAEGRGACCRVGRRARRQLAGARWSPVVPLGQPARVRRLGESWSDPRCCPLWHIKHGRTWDRLVPPAPARPRCDPGLPVAMVSWSSADRPAKC